jgi:molybdopterin-containing oxidoreductase family membrane subunit
MRVEISQKNLVVPLGILWLAALAVGSVGLAQRLLTGHELANYTSAIPWGLWVALYVNFISVSAGAFLLSSLVYVFGMRGLERVAKLGLFTALVSLLTALLFIWLDNGHVARFYFVFTRGNPVSMMAWMVWLYTAYFVLLVVELWFAMRGDLMETAAEETGIKGRVASLLLGRFREAFGERHPLPLSELHDREKDMRVVRVLGAIGIPLAIGFHGGVGALFGVVGAREFWNAPIVPIMFIVAALTSGGALLTAVVAFFWPDRSSAEYRKMLNLLARITIGLLSLYFILLWSEYSITFYADIPAASEPLYKVLGGPYPWVFWVFQVAIGAAIPFTLFLINQGRSAFVTGVASSAIMLGFVANRLNVVIPGLVEPQIEGLDTAYTGARLSFDYFPSLMEWLVVIFISAVTVAMFYVGYRLLPLVTKREVSS